MSVNKAPKPQVGTKLIESKLFDLSNKTSSKFFYVTPNWYQKKFMRNTLRDALNECPMIRNEWWMVVRDEFNGWMNETYLLLTTSTMQSENHFLAVLTFSPNKFAIRKAEIPSGTECIALEPSYANRNLMILDGTSLEQTTLFISLKKLSTWTTLTDPPWMQPESNQLFREKFYWFVRCSGAYEPLTSTSTQCIFHWKPHEWCKFPSKAH